LLYRTDEERAERAAQHRKRRARIRADVQAAKAAAGCMSCGERRPACLRFRHLDAAGNPARLAGMAHNGRRVSAAEMAKCAVICANCHANQR
jgi:hypothetical protein